jgi:hypothetical protein
MVVQRPLDARFVRIEVVHDAALDALHPGETAVVRDVGGLRRPRRHRAQARHHQKRLAFRRRSRRPVGKQPLEQHALFRRERRFAFDKVAKFRVQT